MNRIVILTITLMLLLTVCDGAGALQKAEEGAE